MTGSVRLPRSPLASPVATGGLPGGEEVRSPLRVAQALEETGRAVGGALASVGRDVQEIQDRVRSKRIRTQQGTIRAGLKVDFNRLTNVDDVPRDFFLGPEAAEEVVQGRLRDWDVREDALAKADLDPEVQDFLATRRNADRILFEARLRDAVDARVEAENERQTLLEIENVTDSVRDQTDVESAQDVIGDLAQASGLPPDEARGLQESANATMFVRLLNNPVTGPDTAISILTEFDPELEGQVVPRFRGKVGRHETQLANLARSVMSQAIDLRKRQLEVQSEITADDVRTSGPDAFTIRGAQVVQFIDQLDSNVARQAKPQEALDLLRWSAEDQLNQLVRQAGELGRGAAMRQGTMPSGGVTSERDVAAIDYSQRVDPQLDRILNDPDVDPFQVAEVVSKEVANAGFVTPFLAEYLTARGQDGTARGIEIAARSVSQIIDSNALQFMGVEDRGRMLKSATTIFSDERMGLWMEVSEEIEAGVVPQTALQNALNRRGKRDPGLHSRYRDNEHASGNLVALPGLVQRRLRNDPGVIPDAMALDFERLTQAEYFRNSGDIERARQAASALLMRTWSVQQVDNEPTWTERHPSHEWGSFAIEQLEEDVRKFSDIDPDQVVLSFTPVSNARGSMNRPDYLVFTIEPDGRVTPVFGDDGTPLLLTPKYSTSPENRRNIAKQDNLTMVSEITTAFFQDFQPDLAGESTSASAMREIARSPGENSIPEIKRLYRTTKATRDSLAEKRRETGRLELFLERRLAEAEAFLQAFPEDYIEPLGLED